MSSRLLPPNSTDLERTYADIGGEMSLDPEILATLWDAAACPLPNLPWLAWALSVDEWDATWDESIQRRVIAQTIEIHRLKGTVAAVEKAMSALGHTGNITEWWQMHPQGERHTFMADVEIDGCGIDLAAQTAIEANIIAVKPVRAHFSVRLIANTRLAAQAAIVTLHGAIVTLYPILTEQEDAAPLISHMAIGVQSVAVTTVYPQ